MQFKFYNLECCGNLFDAQQVREFNDLKIKIPKLQRQIAKYDAFIYNCKNTLEKYQCILKMNVKIKGASIVYGQQLLVIKI